MYTNCIVNVKWQKRICACPSLHTEMEVVEPVQCVSRNLLTEKLKLFNLSPFKVNWYLSFLKDREQRVVHNGLCLRLNGCKQGYDTAALTFLIYF